MYKNSTLQLKNFFIHASCYTKKKKRFEGYQACASEENIADAFLHRNLSIISRNNSTVTSGEFALPLSSLICETVYKLQINACKFKSTTTTSSAFNFSL